MKSDFAAAQLHLQRAYDYLKGTDEVSSKVCQTLDVLIEVVATKDCRIDRGKIIRFPDMLKWHRFADKNG